MSLATLFGFWEILIKFSESTVLYGGVPNTDSKVHDRLWVAVAALILGALCDEGHGPCVDLLRVVGVLPVGLSLVTFPG